MAYLGTDADLFICWPASLAGEILAGGFLEILEPGPQVGMLDPPAVSLYGYIIRDWFGPFLLGPPSNATRGRC